MMDGTEQETLELKLDTEGSEDTLPETGKKQFLPTQTSCISLAISEHETPSETSDEILREDCQGNRGDENRGKRSNSTDDASEADLLETRARTHSAGHDEPIGADTASKELSCTSGDIHRPKNGDKCDSSDESRIESPEPPNENSELNEMDTTFMGGVSELDAPHSTKTSNEPVGDASDGENGLTSPQGGSDNEEDSDREDNEELRDAMMGEDDEPDFNKGPEISLPYKEPEQLSLQEFLARRRSKRSGSNQVKKERVSLETADKPLPTTPGSSEEQPKRKSKLHQEILKAAARVTPQLSRCSFVAQTPVDELILKAVSMQNANATSPDAPRKPNNAVPGAQLEELKASLREKIAEQRKRSRQERTKRILGENFEQDAEEEEEEDDYETDEEDFDDEEALLAKAAKDSDAESGDERETDDVAEQPEEEPQPEAIDIDSDIEEQTERRKSQKKRKNAVQDSDDEADRLQDGSEYVDEGDDDFDLQIQDEEEDDASFMHLSQTQVPQEKQRAGKGPLDLDMNSDGSKDVDDDLVALCSGRFATQKSGSGSSKSKEGDEEEDDDEDDDDEEGEEGDREGDEAEGPGAEDEYSDLDEDSGGEQESDPNRRETLKKIKGGDFFEGEAELSGSDVGSDGEDENDGMTEAEKRKFLKSLISENPEISEEELQEQVTRLHFKQLLDDDRKDIRLMKELLLADGDLHSDGPGRERSFRWTNLSNDFVGGHNNGSDDSEHEEETEEEAKWKARRLEREKQKKDSKEIPDSSTAFSRDASSGINESSHKFLEESDLGCEESLSKVLREANKTLKIVVPKRSVDGNSKRVMSGGFLRMNNAVLQKIAEKVKGNTKEKEGSQTTKNFVFRAVDKPEENLKAAKRPSPDTNNPSSKRTKMETVTQLPKSSNQRSIFSKF